MTLPPVAIAAVVGGGRRLLAGRRSLEDRDRRALRRPEMRRLAGVGNITYHALGLSYRDRSLEKD
jgi:hypothetical protein